jgi:membrane-bound ClpP family serine protease
MAERAIAPPINNAIKKLLQNSHSGLETELGADVLTYYGEIPNGLEEQLLSLVEQLASSEDKKDCIAVFLTTTGGSAIAVERYVNIIRHHYNKVIFIVPDYAYSAGTIFCMSGDEIWMDYFSVLGPIDPQVPNKDGRYVPALGYLDKINELIELARNNKLSQAEFLILKDFDLAELRQYEQVRDLTVDLLKKWLVKYKFKDWNTTNGRRIAVTKEMKEARAEEIAKKLGDTDRWKSHSRPINIEVLESFNLRINDYSNDDSKRDKIRAYYKLVKDYVSMQGFRIFIQTRYFL